ncbi:MAG: hypothetical protein QXI58_04680 [Candidatus Micrarchaeia archaeon]
MIKFRDYFIDPKRIEILRLYPQEKKLYISFYSGRFLVFYDISEEEWDSLIKSLIRGDGNVEF